MCLGVILALVSVFRCYPIFKVCNVSFFKIIHTFYRWGFYLFFTPNVRNYLNIWLMSRFALISRHELDHNAERLSYRYSVICSVNIYQTASLCQAVPEYRMNDMFWKDFYRRRKNATMPLTIVGSSKDIYSFFWILGGDYSSKIKLLSLEHHGTSPNTIIMILRSGFKTGKKIYVRRQHFCIQNEGKDKKEMRGSVRYSISLK